MPEPLELLEHDAGLALARSWLADHGGATGEELGEDLGAGHCEECSTLAGARWALGAYVLCLRCVVRRRRAAVAAGVAIDAAGELPRPDALCPWLGDEPAPWIGDEPDE